MVLGLVLAVGAMALGNLKAFGIDWGRNLGNQLSSSLHGLGNDPAIFFVIISFLFSSIGATAIIVANLLINFEAEIRWSFEALILALGGCGTIVYLREDLFKNWLGIPDWAWSGDGYFGSIALAATVFTLLLAFRVARLVTRTNDEENRTFIILRRLDSLVRSKQVTPVLGEIFALLVFAGITIFLALFTKPHAVDGWIRLLVDMSPCSSHRSSSS